VIINFINSPKFLIFLLLIAFIIIPAQALSPLWVSNLTEIDQDIQDTSGRHFLLFLAISDDGKTIATASFDGSIYLMNEKGKVLQNITAGNESLEILSLSLSPEGDYLAFSDAGFSPASNPPKKITLMDRNCEELWNHPTRTFTYILAVSSDGLYSVFGSYENITCVDKDGSVLWNYPEAAVSLDISDDFEYIVAITDNQKAFCLNRSGSVIWENKFRSPNNIKISADGNYVSLTTTLRKLYLMESTGAPLWNKTLPPGTKYAKSEISSDGDEIVVRINGAISGYDRSGMLRWNYTKEPASIFSLSKDGRYSVVAANDSLLLLDEEGNETGTFPFDEKIRGVAISSDGSKIAAITSNELYYFDNPDAELKDSDITPDETLQTPNKEEKTPPATQTKQSPLPVLIIIFSIGLAVFFRGRP
jgi:WD40 repeat protein